MSSKNKNLSSEHGEIPSGETFRIGIVVSEWNTKITNSLLDACLTTLRVNGVKEDMIKRIDVPGTFELPVGAKMLLSEDSYDAVICLGCVITGETKHDEYISMSVAANG